MARGRAIATAFVLLCLLAPAPTIAQDVGQATSTTTVAAASSGATPSGAAPSGATYTEGGVEACTECHDDAAILSILKSRHAVKGDARTPLAKDHACETCHGPSAEHAEDSDVPVSVAFGGDRPAAQQNAVCLSCHQGGGRILWSGSEHQSHDVACVSCHQVHAPEDPMTVRDVRPERITRHDQTQRCFTCHPDIRPQMYLRSAHPFKAGRILCSDCHAVHGSTTDALLAQETVNETCYECHAEKRGPFLWEHQPARESCTNCHTPHGSNHESLLVARGPWLCQQCHMAERHPSGAYDGSGLANRPVPNRNLLAKNCMNCHSEVHGSNHPSGVRLTR